MWERLDNAQLESDGTNCNNLKEKWSKIQKKTICGHMSTNSSSTCHKKRTKSTLYIQIDVIVNGDPKIWFWTGEEHVDWIKCIVCLYSCFESLIHFHKCTTCVTLWNLMHFLPNYSLIINTVYICICKIYFFREWKGHGSMEHGVKQSGSTVPRVWLVNIVDVKETPR